MHITFCPSNFIPGIPVYVENDKYSRISTTAMFLIEDDSGNDLNILSIESQLNQLWLIYIIYTMD